MPAGPARTAASSRGSATRREITATLELVDEEDRRGAMGLLRPAEVLSGEAARHLVDRIASRGFVRTQTFSTHSGRDGAGVPGLLAAADETETATSPGAVVRLPGGQTVEQRCGPPG